MDAGESAFTFYGGISRKTGERSSITANSIIAIKGKAMAAKGFSQVPPLSNRELFRRDRHICAYCGAEFGFLRLTRDHITPLSRGGRDHWMNVVSACRHCNGIKRNRKPRKPAWSCCTRLMSEQGRVPDPYQPQDPFRPDGFPGAARRRAQPRHAARRRARLGRGSSLAQDFWRHSGFHLLGRDAGGGCL